ncbi:MAG: rhomboid family intramembrane serine protease [Candidatus Pacebacteria bacterium]|nr:rhomboid family intramembrane serine protease [Candidatus Paceibacterota bacterium]
MLSDRDYIRHNYRRPTSHNTSIVFAIIVANVIVFILQMMSGNRLTEYLWLHSHYLLRGQVWRLGTHMFAHGGLGHIFFNMWGLYIFGKPLEDRIGGERFLYLYFVSGIMGALTWLLFNWGGAHPVIGASGAVFGILVASAMTFPNRVYMLLFPPIPMKLKTLAVVFGVIEVISLLSLPGSPIARLAHLGGMIGGFLYVHWGLGKPRGLYSGTGSRSFSPASWWRQLRAKFFHSTFRSTDNGADHDDEDTISPAEVDRILDKIGEHGLSSLSKHERDILDKARDRLRNKH